MTFLVFFLTILAFNNAVQGHSHVRGGGHGSLRVQHDHTQHENHHNHDEHHNEHHHAHTHHHTHGRHTQAGEGDFSCGTHDMNDKDRAAQDKVLSLVKRKQQKQLAAGKPAYQANTPKVIPVCFHVVGQRISRRQLNKDLQSLNKAFSSKSCCDPKLSWCNGECSEPQTNIRFVMARKSLLRSRSIPGQTTRSPLSLSACVKYKRSRVDMSVDFYEYDIKQQMREGNGEILNVYYSDLGDGLLGFAYYPNILETNPVLDGVVIHRESRVGGSLKNYNEGDTLTHEVGHSFGLPHSFVKGSCSLGSGIPDIPRQSSPTHGCKPEQVPDTCPDDPGVDAIHNFMDYSYDSCLFQFTQGQIDVMHANIEYFRQGKRKDLTPVELNLGEYSAPHDLVKGSSQEFFLNVPAESDIVCKVHADGGDADMFIRWDGVGSGYECAATGPTSSETCFLKATSARRAQVIVDAGATVVDFTVFCSRKTEHSDPRTELSTGVADVSSGGAQGVVQAFTLPLEGLNIFQSVGMIQCQASGSVSADVDLYMSLNDNMERAPCVSQQSGSAPEVCQLTPGDASKVYIWLFFAETAFQQDITLECNLVPFEAIKLTTGVESELHSVSLGQTRHFYVESPSASSVVCETHATNGNIDLLMSVNEPSQYECSSDNFDSVENCAVQLGEGYAFIEIFGKEATEDFTVTCSVRETVVIELESGQPLTGLNLVQGEFAYFSLNVPTNSVVSCSTLGDTGDIDLNLNWDGGTIYDCISASVDSNESCSMGPDSGTAYVIVYGFLSTEDFSLTCTLS